MLGNRAFFIFSVNQIDQHYEVNQDNTEKIFYEVSDLGGKPVDGCYKGKLEDSFILGAKHENFIMETAKEYNQESVLFVNELGQASLIFLKDNKTTKLGQFKEVDTIEGLDNYTYDSTTNKYYTVK